MSTSYAATQVSVSFKVLHSYGYCTLTYCIVLHLCVVH